ncbi:hypothetical protein PFISCL1PPCAC_638, partial [Pristionchus fissidentatus]
MIEPGQSQWYTGWGYTSVAESQKPAGNMQQAFLPINNPTVCRKSFFGQISNFKMLKYTPIYFLFTQDFGGPLVQQKTIDSPWFQYGISSFHSENCEDAGLFTRVTSYCFWISVMTGIKC